MKKLLFCTLFFSVTLFGKYHYQIGPINSQIKSRMVHGGSYRSGCPVGLSDLRYIQLEYIDFSGDTKSGELIVHRTVADDIVSVFAKLYKQRYPIKSMRLVSDYDASDFRSIEADNTSAFNCRHATGSKKWSKHSYGKAIDINPIENPYVSRSGRIAHKKSLVFRKRSHLNRAVILKNDLIVKEFKARGWRWGGDWRSIKDYQHFDK